MIKVLTVRQLSPIELSVKPLGFGAVAEYVYILNGVNNAIETYRRLIPDPLTDDFGVKFTLYDPVNTGGTFVAQNIASSPTSREFQIYQTSGVATMLVGGVATQLSYNITQSGDYELTLVGTTYTLYKDSVQVDTGSFTRGTSSEPTATFVVGARHGDTLDSYGFRYAGAISNVEVYPIAPTVFAATNYPIDDRSQFLKDLNAVEQPELLVNPWGLVGTGWTQTGDYSFDAIVASGELRTFVGVRQNLLTKVIVNAIVDTGTFAVRVGGATADTVTSTGDYVFYQVNPNTDFNFRIIPTSFTGSVTVSVINATEAEIIQYDENDWVNKDDL